MSNTYCNAMLKQLFKAPSTNSSSHYLLLVQAVVDGLCVLGCSPIKKHINRMMRHRSELPQMDSGERNVLWLPEGHGLYKGIA